MDLNASPEPEEDEEIFEPNFSEDSAPEEKHSHQHHQHHVEHHHVEHVETAVDIMRRVFNSLKPFLLLPLQF